MSIKKQFNGDNVDRKNFYKDTFSGYDVIVELGVGFGETSAIFIECANKKVIGIDIRKFFNTDVLTDFAKTKNIEYSFILSDSLKISPPACDVLFIDSKHTEHQVYNELKIYSPFVSTYIAIHDINPDTFDGNVLRATNKWLEEGENKNWEEYYRDYNQCGLLVLKRKITNGSN